jgi:hypothetical protein
MENGAATAPLVLGPEEVVEDRLFAHPDHVTADRSTLCFLIRDVHRRVKATTGPIDEWIPSAENWYRHVIVPRPGELSNHEKVTVVGFFGRRRDLVAMEVAQGILDMSAELDRLIPQVEGVLAYSTHLLADELNYANLVMLRSEDMISAWRDIPPHPIAAGNLSKQYYAFVRIYHGSISVADLGTEGAVRLSRVKYWDYRSEPTWTAQRELV